MIEVELRDNQGEKVVICAGKAVAKRSGMVYNVRIAKEDCKKALRREREECLIDN